MWLSDSPSKSCAESPLEGSSSEDSVVSGPSSPSAALHSLRCTMCERLFSKMRRQGPPSKKQRDHDPASLSCDEWLLNKTWHPQRRKQSRGRLWVHLKHIRLRAAKQSDHDMANTAWWLCSRPHVFLQRNLRRCKTMFGKPSKSKAKSRNQQRNRAKSTICLRSGNYQRSKRKKSSEKDDTPEHLSPVDLSTTSEDELPGNDRTRREGVPRLETIQSKQCVSDTSGFMDTHADCSGLEGTRRVLKFDTFPKAVLAETQKPKHYLVNKSAGGKLHEGPADFEVKNGHCPRRQDELPCEDLDVFRTPTDLFSADLKITRKSKPLRPRKHSFRSMLAALGHGHKQIIKESHSHH